MTQDGDRRWNHVIVALPGRISILTMIKPGLGFNFGKKWGVCAQIALFSAGNKGVLKILPPVYLLLLRLKKASISAVSCFCVYLPGAALRKFCVVSDLLVTLAEDSDASAFNMLDQ